MSALNSAQKFQEWTRAASPFRRTTRTAPLAARSLAAGVGRMVTVDLPNGEVMAIDLEELRRILQPR